ncbi:hypothetical protein GIB67_022336 [Kingdonia uniflora]|uniref:RRM domain-containing protein n=1 Tax=Kingdonia uniflora TaxID=39325 RepID=A0A7J7MIC3_9MAGN|nr:hypothetical protein GIB67_022336 [Kingdonia uniflora]
MKAKPTETPKVGTTKKVPVKKTPPKPSDTAKPKPKPKPKPKQVKASPTAKAVATTSKTVAKPVAKVEEATAPVENVQAIPKVLTAETKTTPEIKATLEVIPEVNVTAEVTPQVRATPEVKAETPEVKVTLEVTPEVKTTPEVKATPETKTVKPAVKKTPGKAKPAVKKTPTGTKASSAKKTPKIAVSAKTKVGESPKEKEPTVADVDVLAKEKESVVVKVKESPNKGKAAVVKSKESPIKEKPIAEASESVKTEEPIIVVKENVNEEISIETEPIVDAEIPDATVVNVFKDSGEEVQVNVEEDPEENADDAEETQLEKEEHGGPAEGLKDFNEQEGFEEPGNEECAEEDASEPEDEAGHEEEQREIFAKERKIKKEKEIFVGGLDRETVEDDIKEVFEKVGEVIEVRLHRNPLTKKNRGYAFVKFADKEHAKRALSELKTPIIRGKRCGVSTSDDNDTLFVGNICNSWTKEAIKQRMKEFGVEGVENMTLVSDARREDLSRGFAFVEFSCHADAMNAYKRLQKPDVIFGHAERTVKVAFAEPLREPDPEIMAQVKTVFVDGLPPHWDEERVTEHFKRFGKIERISLARNKPSAKRKDFGFVDFSTHEAAIACTEALNNTELGEGKSKARVRVRLSSPLPKTQAVKGGMRGGFRIGRAVGGNSSRFGREFGRGGQQFNRNSQRGRGFFSHAGQSGRFAFEGGRRGYDDKFSPQTAPTSRPDRSRPRPGVPLQGGGKSIQPRRPPFMAEEEFHQPFDGRHFVHDPYMYNDSGHGTKRPFSMLDYEPGYLEPSRIRPRFENPDTAALSREARYRDAYGPHDGLYSRDYYGSDYAGSSYSSRYGGGDRSYGGGYYY